MPTVPVWLWINLLSLDAVAVAVAWQLVFARSFHVHVPAAATAILGLSVWLVYVADRLLDARAGTPQTPRHRFHRDHARQLAPALLVGALVGLVAVRTALDPGLVSVGVPMAALMTVYFVMVHVAPRSWRSHWPKEFTVAVLFALGTGLPVYAEAPATMPAILVPLAVYAWLLWINAVAIDRWEQGVETQWMAPLALLASVASFSLAVLTGRVFLYGAASLAGLGLAALASRHHQFSRPSIPVLADAALAIPAFTALAVWFRR